MYRAFITNWKHYLESSMAVMIPTETVYGICARADLVTAVEKIRALKRRSSLKTFAVFLDPKLLNRYFYIDASEAKLIKNFMPGPVTILLRPRGSYFLALARNGKVGVRVPNVPELLYLLQTIRTPLIATSANISGRKAALGWRNLDPRLTDDDQVYTERRLKVATLGVASSIFEFKQGLLRTIRQGNIKASTIQSKLSIIAEC